MQFVKGGPDIPAELLLAHEEGRLVLFCGAGVSLKAGLPNFKGLIDKIYWNFHDRSSGQEEKHIKSESYDRVVSLLEDRFGDRRVRSAVRKILEVPCNPDLSVHSAIIKLSENHENQKKKIVTTNFDLLFEEEDSNLKSFSAPALPVPKLDNWHGIVHLHGCLDSNDPEGRNLVLTSADFGTAYMSEGWASRFVVELFRNYTIIFIGYGINDPVMRYLLDALAADRRLRNDNRNVYAFAGYEASKGKNKEEWTEKSITPIFYDSLEDHRLLHETLMSWANQWSDGLLSKISIMNKIATRSPERSHDYEKRNLCQLIQDSSGKVARAFFELGTQVDFGWCEEFDKFGIFNVYGKNESALMRESYSPDLDIPLNEVQLLLAIWILEHVENPKAFRWIIGKGHILHRDLKMRLHSRLTNSTMPEPLRMAWSVLSGKIPLDGDEDCEIYYDNFLNRVGQEAWSPVLRTEIMSAFSPCLQIRPLPNLGNYPSELMENQEQFTSIPFFYSDCVLRCGSHAIYIYQALKKREDWPAIVQNCSYGFTELLRRAMDMQAIVYDASETHDSSRMKIHLIAKNPQHISPDGWVILIMLLMSTFDCLRAENSENASALVDSWRMHRYPVFRRLILYALSQGIGEGTIR